VIDLRGLVREDDAVSSVLGVVLMVAVTIVLAAIIGTYVLGIGSDLTDSSPSASFEISGAANGGNGSVLVLHGGGDDVRSENVEVTVDSTTVYRNGQPAGASGFNVSGWGDSQVTTNDRLTIEMTGTSVQSGDMVYVLWTSDDSSTILAEQQLR